MTENESFNWETLTYVENEFDDFGKTQAVQIRWAKIYGGRRVFSYVLGVLTKNEDSEEAAWSPYKYIPDRFVVQYVKLISEAAEVVKNAVYKAEKDLQANLTVKMSDMIKAKREHSTQ